MTATLLLLLVACRDNAEDMAGPSRESTASSRSFDVRIDVIPAQVVNDDGDFRVLPTSTTLNLAEDVAFEVPEIKLETPVSASGAFVAFKTNPTIADLPGTRTPIAGTVTLVAPGTIQSFATQVGDDGAFVSWVLPGTAYELTMLPLDPLLPTWSGPLPGTGDLGVLDLGPGAPLYGLIEDDDGPLAGASVFAVDAEGHQTPTTTTDDDGYFQLRVGPGTWSVVSDGVGSGVLPRLTNPLSVVDESGQFVSFRYASADDRVFVEGSVRSPTGAQVPGSVVRFTSRALDRYARGPQEASFVADAPVGTSGNYLLRLAPGTYDVELLPPGNDDGSAAEGPRRLEAVALGQDTVLDLVTSRLVDTQGTVRDAEGLPLADARVMCQEIGFDGHTFTAFTSRSGRFETAWPPVPMRCEISPPGDREDLAIAVLVVDASNRGDRSFKLVTGVAITGTVSAAGEPEAGAVVEVRDPEGHLLGFDLTDEDGAWSMRLDPNPAGVTTAP